MSALDRESVDAAMAQQLGLALDALRRLSEYLSPRLTLDEQLTASGPLLHAKVLIQAVQAGLTKPVVTEEARIAGRVIDLGMRRRPAPHRDLLTIPDAGEKS